MIIGIMGPGEGASEAVTKTAFALGQAIAKQGWTVLTGGRNVGVMHAASQGAKSIGGQTIGILMDADKKRMSEYVDIPIITDLGSARNNINVLTSDVVVACGMGPGTASEVSLAVKAKKPVILVNATEHEQTFFNNLGVPATHCVTCSDAVIELIKRY